MNKPSHLTLVRENNVEDQIDLGEAFLDHLNQFAPTHGVNLWMLFDVLAYMPNDWMFVDLDVEPQSNADLKKWATTLKQEFIDFGHGPEEKLTIANLMKTMKAAGVSLKENGNAIASDASARVAFG